MACPLLSVRALPPVEQCELLLTKTSSPVAYLLARLARSPLNSEPERVRACADTVADKTSRRDGSMTR